MLTKDVLYKDFPKIFPTKTLWFGDGWNELLWEACNFLQATIDNNDKWHKYYYQPVVYSTKEKYGELRISNKWADDTVYVESEIDKQWAVNWGATVTTTFDFAEYRSSVTCEITGKPGQLVDVNGWYKTLCKEEAIKAGVKVIEE